MAERVLEVVAAGDPRAHLGVEELATAPAVLLRLVERDVRVAEECTRVDLALAGERDAHARGDECLEAVEIERLVERLDDALRDVLGLGDVLEVLAQHDELVTAETGDGVADAHDGADPLRSLPKQHIAGLVAQAVVHHLEVVEVEEQHAESAASPTDEVDRVLCAIEEEHAVRKVGERVVGGLVRELGLRARRLLRVPGSPR